jgi:multidrug efflux pump subunit AcrB
MSSALRVFVARPVFTWVLMLAMVVAGPFPAVLSVRTPLGPPTETSRPIAARSEDGRRVYLPQLGSIRDADAPPIIRRTNRQRQVTLFMNTVPGTSDDAVVGALEQSFRELDLPPGYRAEVIGNASEMEKAEDAFLTAILLSFVFMYLVIAAQFESWLHPITILASLPLTLPFALASLLVGGQSLNLFSALGFLVLFGIVKKNSILQIDHILALRARGMPRMEAVVLGNVQRLRPILMTTVAFVAGLFRWWCRTAPARGRTARSRSAWWVGRPWPCCSRSWRRPCCTCGWTIYAKRRRGGGAVTPNPPSPPR